MELISGLPEDLARDCLIRVSYQQFPTVASVCKNWKEEVESPEFRRQRRRTGISQKLLVMVHARCDPDNEPGSGSSKRLYNPVYRLSVFEPVTGNWSELPAPPEFESGLPMFCRVASVGSELILLGGLDPNTWKASDSVLIYNFITAKWRRGTHMPGGSRMLFACVSDSRRMVFVAGGHDDEKNALRSALAYDVAEDKWISLPDMAAERDECTALFRHGRLAVVGGYRTETQGVFERSAEVFDVATWQWGPVMEEFLDCATCPRNSTDGGDVDGRVIMCCGEEIKSRQGGTWQKMGKVPVEIRNVAYVGALDGGAVVIGSNGHGEAHESFVFDLKSCNWRKVETPEKFRGHVQTGCVLEI
ncbi:hypothetical protein HN51_053402 [Arachis hypogaea]|uniref:F-box/kelch-repeat protein n=1 Tax=Arachis hypogaea TaxID=3818 RepID=A0A444XC55_ARAHY|nr:F-box/kelch-repeat protein At1g80440 [Arachis ipaensis]XP_025674884.1 F-box/kelch-repeat protein At1g80440 [Arachis hypogaea]QHN75742.1 F-box/kelch-repeat protein [Arachis hypogaea]RYQ87294.1 hypothetical protein Ahy_B09g094774 [Arachis hypogaea]